ncbi:Ig-like domain-containing protein [Xylanibacter ruminicola]|uniref:Ig-like domain-containing protein n=1 Tax=Xylanibacter ruminicola TaxID=839 RepID=UPI0009B84318|nr:Ig-like domain-containing protein [Xylanibacter ruminicola]
MTKQLLSLQTLTRSIIFLVITIMPTTLRAEDITTYGLTVGGTEVTSANATNILGDGTVSFTPATDDLPATLTLNNATINGNITAENNLVVRFVGENTMYRTSNDMFMFTGNYDSTLSFETDADNPGKLRIIGSTSKYYIADNWMEAPAITEEVADGSDEKCNWMVEYNSADNYTDLKLNKKYPLWLDSHQVTDATLFYSGVSYDRESAVLTYGGYYDSFTIKSSLPNLTIIIEGEGQRMKSISFEPTVDVLSGNLTFDIGYNSNVSLSLSDSESEGGVISGFSQVILKNPLQVSSPENFTEWTSNIKTVTIANAPCYNIMIAGTFVSEANKDDVLGDGRVSYNNDEHTLTLNNATITMGNGSEPDAPTMEAPCIEYSGTDPLTISIIGNNVIESYNGVSPIRQNSDIRSTLVFGKGDDMPCSLRISSPGETVIDGFKSIQGVNGVNNEDGNDLIAIAADELEIDEENGLHYISSSDNVVESLVIADDYRLKVSGVAVSSYNASDVLSEDSQNKGKVSFKQENGNSILTLNNAKINSDGIISSVEELTIDLIGESETSGSIRAQGDNCRLIFTSAQENRGAAKLNFWYSVDTPISGFSEGNVVYNSGLCLRDDATNSSLPKVVALFIPHVEIDEPEHGLYFPDHVFKMTQKEEAEGFNLYYANMIGASTPVKTEDGTFTLAASDNSYAIRCYAVYPGGDTEASRNYQFASHFYPKVITKPVFSLSAEEIYNEPQRVSITGLTQNTTEAYISDLNENIQVPQIWYYLNDNKNDSIRYNDETPITVSESTKISFYVIDGDSGKKIKSDIVEAQYVIRQNPGVSFTAETAQYTIGTADNPTLPTLQDASDLEVTYSSNNENVATINESGEVTVIGIGEATISATTAQTDTYLSQTVSYTLTVYKDLTHSSITATITDATYTGETLTPAVTMKDGDKNLAQAATPEDTGDYTVIYSNNTYVATSTDEKAPTAIITGKGYYTGTITLTFSIIAKSLAEATITLSETEFAYDGNVKKPSVTIKFESDGSTGSGGSTGNATILTEGTDYDVTYKKVVGESEEDIAANEIINASTYKAIATAKGNYTGSKEAAFTISKATPSITFDEESYSIAFGETFTPPTPTTCPEGLTVTATSSSNTQVATITDGTINIIGVGETIITVSFAGNNNYEATTATYTLNVAAGTATGVTATGYEGTYDAKAHGISVSAPEGATVKYGIKKGTYDLTESPTYTDAGTYWIHYQVEHINYITIADSATVEIIKADITPTITLEGWPYDSTPNTPEVKGNTGNGKETITYKGEGSEVFTTEVPTALGTHIVMVTIAETTNYNGAEATNTFTISPATMTVTASGYEGAYDGKAHGITVAAPEGATVMYGTQEGTYDLTASPTFTDAGTYQVYYQVSKENYTPVTGSKTVEISKAAGGLAYSAATASAELNGDGWTAPSLSNPHGLDITYSSSNTAVATVSATGAVSLTGIGQTTIKATSANNINYADSEAQYVLTVTRGKAKSYGVKIGDTEVNEDNYTDIFGDDGTDDGDHKRVSPSMLFNPEKNTLLIIGSNEGLTIESTLPELNIHLSQDNKLKKVVFNNQGNSANTGKVLFTCDSNFPGKLTIENTEGESAISGFASVGYEFGLQVLAPEDATYKDGKMVNGNGAVVSTLTIGVVLNPLTGDEPDELNPDDFTVTYPDGTTATIDLTNNAINNILYTLNNDTEGQGYDPEYNDIGIVTTMTDEVVTQVANDVANSTLIVGSDDYANRFIGLTFIVQGGEGTIKIAQEVEDGYGFHLKIGNNDAVKVADYIITQPNADVPYQLDDATLCWLYLVKKPGASTRMRSTRVNKRSKLMGSIKHVNIKAKTVASTNSATKVSGGIITVAANNALTDIEDTQVDNQSQSSQHNKWYTLDGRQINKPSQKGLYFNNKKKIVIK